MKDLRVDLCSGKDGHWFVDVTNQGQSRVSFCLDVDGEGQFMFWTEEGSFAIPWEASLDARKSVRLGLSSVGYGEFDVCLRVAEGDEIYRKRASCSSGLL